MSAINKKNEKQKQTKKIFFHSVFEKQTKSYQKFIRRGGERSEKKKYEKKNVCSL